MAKKAVKYYLFESSNDMFNKRIDYTKGIIDPKILVEDPLDVLLVWINDAIESNLIEEANAINLSTIEDDGYPRSRIVLLKDFSKKAMALFRSFKFK